MGLEVRDLCGSYGSVPVLQGVSFEVADGESIAVLGRNGSGKTTLLRGLMGLLPRCSGSINLDGQPLEALPTFRRARAGVAYVPQGRDIFPELTVEENLRLGHLRAGRRMSHPLPDDVMEHFSWMRGRLRQQGGTLSGGEQQMLAVARMLIAEPKMLFLDEPTEGLAPAVVHDLAELLAGIVAARHLAILVVEQNVAFALRLANRGYVMEKGQFVAAGSATELASEDVVGRRLTI
jgi:ABC-type branched-chain amino acid transport systems, ATPase component